MQALISNSTSAQPGLNRGSILFRIIGMYDDHRKRKEADEMGKACKAFRFSDALAAYEHMRFEVVEDYGSQAYGHVLYTWDDGERYLARCKNCGGYVLVQNSEFHSFTDSGDSYYSDYFPVGSPEEADELNRKYDGFQIETEFSGRYLMVTNGRLSWSR